MSDSTKPTQHAVSQETGHQSDGDKGGQSGTNTPPAGREQVKEFEPITSQEEFDRRLTERLRREREKYSDYEDLKTKAQQLAEIEESQKTEQQKLQDQLQQAQDELTRYKRAEEHASWTAQVSKETGVPAETLRGESLEEIKAHAELLKPHISKSERVEIPSLGKHPGNKTSTESDFVNELFGRNN